jgi:hypothetical protein
MVWVRLIMEILYTVNISRGIPSVDQTNKSEVPMYLILPGIPDLGSTSTYAYYLLKRSISFTEGRTDTNRKKHS